MQELVGKSFDRFEIHEVLGKGGHAWVFKALEAGLDREVALKVLKKDLLENESILARFVDEAKRMAALEHPHILTIHHYGECDGTGFMAMQLATGSLQAMVEEGQPSSDGEILEVMRQVGGALQFAHDRGVVHRDIKPHNILIDAHGAFQLADFGIAKVLGDDSGRTIPGNVLGTPRYMSPEQCEAKDIDHRSDIFSLGVLLYEMATGAAPFDAETSTSIMLKVVKDDPLPPRQVNASIAPRLEATILKALAKSPDARYSSVSEMVKDVEMALRDSRTIGEDPTRPSPAVRVEPDDPGDRGPNWWQNKLVLGGAVAVVAVVVLAIAFGGNGDDPNGNGGGNRNGPTPGPQSTVVITNAPPVWIPPAEVHFRVHRDMTKPGAPNWPPPQSDTAVGVVFAAAQDGGLHARLDGLVTRCEQRIASKGYRVVAVRTQGVAKPKRLEDLQPATLAELAKLHRADLLVVLEGSTVERLDPEYPGSHRFDLTLTPHFHSAAEGRSAGSEPARTLKGKARFLDRDDALQDVFEHADLADVVEKIGERVDAAYQELVANGRRVQVGLVSQNPNAGVVGVFHNELGKVEGVLSSRSLASDYGTVVRFASLASVQLAMPPVLQEPEAPAPAPTTPNNTRFIKLALKDVSVRFVTRGETAEYISDGLTKEPVFRQTDRDELHFAAPRIVGSAGEIAPALSNNFEVRYQHGDKRGAEAAALFLDIVTHPHHYRIAGKWPRFASRCWPVLREVESFQAEDAQDLPPGRVRLVVTILDQFDPSEQPAPPPDPEKPQVITMPMTSYQEQMALYEVRFKGNAGDLAQHLEYVLVGGLQASDERFKDGVPIFQRSAGEKSILLFVADPDVLEQDRRGLRVEPINDKK